MRQQRDIKTEPGQQLYSKLTNKHGKGKALSILMERTVASLSNAAK